MNSVHASTGLSMFELRHGRSPRVLPPLVGDVDVSQFDPSQNDNDAKVFLDNIALTVWEACDNLTLAKVVQAYQLDKNRGPCELFKEGDWVMLSTYHCQEVFKKSGEKRAAKFFACFDGLYEVINICKTWIFG
ncbi:hypothetical protein GG344DRAFT_60781 [Lentinula edodes]|nr:hypothetical protein GG344DRAFT_60781 [Lentinula edodes]